MINFSKIMDEWDEKHQNNWLSMLRMMLGVFLFAKGVVFLGDREIIINMLSDTIWAPVSGPISHYVVIAHLAGGILIALGVFIRLAILFQIPVVLGAVIFVNAVQAMAGINSELEFSVLVLFLLGFFLFYGPGPISIEHYLRTHRRSESVFSRIIDF